MEYRQKVISYKGRIVFEKLNTSQFQRIPKLYQKNEACFMFINQGEFSVRSPNHFISFKKGKGLLAKCFDYFFEMNKSQQANNPYLELIGVILYPEMMEELFQFDWSSSSYKVNYNVKQIHVDALLSSYKESINIIIDNPELADDTLIKTKLKEFVLLLSKKEKAPSEIDFLSAMFHLNAADLKTTVLNNLYADLSIPELAKLCNMSVSTFKRKFKAAFHDSPRKYIAKKKLEKASQLLLIQENRIADIAFECGYESLATFNRNFRSTYGCSPSQFRLNQNDPLLS